MRKTAIIVPCYNEAKRLKPEEFQKYARQDRDVTFIFVNDCSTDNTRAVISGLCQSNQDQMLSVDLPRNRGKAETVRAGFLHAFALNFDFIGYWDADLATPLYEIDKFRDLLADRQIHMVLGSRIRLLNRRISRKPLRHYLGRIFATFASLVLGVAVYDTQCGAKIFRNTSALQKVFRQPFTVNWIFDVEILARFILLGQKTDMPSLEECAAEYPLEEWRDVPGSKINCLSFITAIQELIKIIWILRGPGSRQTISRLLAE